MNTSFYKRATVCSLHNCLQIPACSPARHNTTAHSPEDWDSSENKWFCHILPDHKLAFADNYEGYSFLLHSGDSAVEGQVIVFVGPVYQSRGREHLRCMGCCGISLCICLSETGAEYSGFNTRSRKDSEDPTCNLFLFPLYKIVF